MSVYPTPESLLQTYFGFSQFRSGQLQVIEQILAGKSSVAVFPTGSGKSLCYQLPALVLPGLTLIVAPLLALMKDQIDALKARGIHASRLDSTLSHDEYQSVMQDVRAGVVKILYVAPERFMNERFRNSLTGLSISLFAVDEAHCISAWGHNFRPDYLKLPLFAESFGARAILALTATATPQVLLDIEKSFKIQPGCSVVTGFYRPNLTLLTIPIRAADRDDRLLSELLTRDRGPTIIYVTLQKTAEKLSSFLNEKGIPAQFYHAGMANEDRVAVQNWFITSDTGIIVATIAFGMGIDKADIRYVYHYNLPKSLESYSQEIGRAGRDGQASICAMFACPDDMNVLENFVYGDKPSRLSVQKLIDEIFAHDKTYSVSLMEASTRLDIRSIVLSTLMAYLELKGFLQAETPYYQIYQFKCLIPWPEIVNKLPEDRHEFLNGLYRYAEKKLTWHTLDLEAAVKGLNEHRSRIVTALNWLSEKGYIEVKASQLRNSYRLMQCPEGLKELAGNLYHDMETREKDELVRLSRILEWAVAPRCLTNALCSYFGEQRDQDCGHCSYCLGTQERTLPARRETSKSAFESAVKQGLELSAQNPKLDIEALAITRFLCGISSPRFARTKLSSKHPLFGILADTPFAEVLSRVENAIN